MPKSYPWKSFTPDEQLRAWRTFRGQKCSIENTGMLISDPEVFLLHNFGSDRLSDQRNGLHTGSNSGYQAINLAYLAGAARILLLGYDMRFTGGKSHAHNGHPIKHPESVYSSYAKTFATMLPQLKARDCEVINCTPDSAVTCFQKGELNASLLRNP